MIKKNDLFEAEITAMTAEGSGICRADGMAVFVPGTAAVSYTHLTLPTIA